MLKAVLMNIEYLMMWLLSIPTEVWIQVVLVGIVLGVVGFLMRHTVKVLIAVGVTMIIVTTLLAL